MILLLVIALLVLLALMGTIFILMASTDKQSAYASNSSTSLNMAQQGVLNTVRGLMLNQTLDENNNTLAVGTYTTAAGFTPDHYVSATVPGQIARFWDYPEVGAMPAGSTPSQFYQTAIVAGASVTTPTQYAPSEAWLVNNQPYEPGNNYIPGEEYYTCSASLGVANADPYRMIVATPPATMSQPAEQYAGASGAPGDGFPLLSTLSPYLYDPSTGGYDIDWYFFSGYAPVPAVGTAMPGPPAYTVQGVLVPNAAVVEPRWAYSTADPGSNDLAPNGTLDAMWNLLPYSSPNGTRYRFAVRIMDMSSLLNVNTGWIPSADSTASTTDAPYGEYGTYISSCPILDSPVNTSSSDTTAEIQAAQSGTSPSGREGSYSGDSGYTYSIPVWQAGLNDYEQQYPSISGGNSYNLSLFGLNSEMDLLTAAGAGGMPFGSPYYSRPATLLRNTLGLEAGYYGSGYRSLYTTYSWTRDIAPVNVTAGSTTSAPPKLNLSAPISATLPTSNPANFTTFAQNMYNTLVACGYQQAHACAFLANYFTYRYGVSSGTATFAPATLVVASTGSSATLTPPPTSPLGTATATITTTGAPASTTFVGNAAQPFLNQLEIAVQKKGGGSSVVGWGVDISNPFPGTNPILFGNGTAATDWQIVVSGGTSVDLYTAFKAGIPAYQPGAAPTSIEVVIGGTNVTESAAAKGALYTGAPATIPISGTISLERPVPGGTMEVVDQINYNFTSVPTPNPAKTNYGVLERDNSAEWSCDSGLATAPPPFVALTTDPRSLGVLNTITSGVGYDSGNVGMPLYDRFYSGYASGDTPFLANAVIDANDDLVNIDDFNCIAREGSYQTTAGVYTPLSAQIAENTATPGVGYNAAMPYVDTAVGKYPTEALTKEALQAALYFDFAYDPRAAFNAANAALDTSGVPPTILAMTTLTDRTSNTAAAAALPYSTTDLVRQAGKININTAGPDVLYSAFSNDGALWNGATTAPTSAAISLLVDDAIGFRGRLTNTGSSIPQVPLFSVSGSTVTVKMQSNPNDYSGFTPVADASGFRSTADLLVAFLPTIFTAGDLYTGSTAPTTLQQRDAAWADVENFISVRSDTFAVYGLVQALRLNPNYTGTYVPTDWYNANQGVFVPAATSSIAAEYTISTDPTNQNAEFILEGSRRFIAIIDRSYCNGGNATPANGAAVQPHIVALKMLPQ